MDRFAAFLRGINLGRRRVTGEQLCAPFRDLGLENVTSFLASGNVVFTAPDATDEAALEAAITSQLERHLGYHVLTFLRGSDELTRIVTHEPFEPEVYAGSAGKLQVVLLAAPPPDPEAVLGQATDDDRLALQGRQLWWLPSAGVSTSDLDLAGIARLTGPTTIRTANTLRRLHTRFFRDA